MSQQQPTTHPDPKSKPRTKRTKLWLILMLIAAIGGGIYAYFQKEKILGLLSSSTNQQKSPTGGDKGAKGESGKNGRPKQIPSIAFATVKKQNVNIDYQALGTIESNQLVNVTSRVDGKLLKLMFEEGQFVNKGQVLAELDGESINNNINQAQANIDAVKEDLKNAIVDEQRYKTLYAQDSISKQKLDTQSALVAKLKATINANQATLDNSRLQRQYTKITAPISGVIGMKKLDAGEYVRASDTSGIASIINNDQLTVVFSLPDQQASEVAFALKQKRKPIVQILTADTKTPAKSTPEVLATGSVVSADNQLDLTTASLKFKAKFSSLNASQTKWLANQYVNLNIQAKQLPESLVLPLQAVMSTQKGYAVWLIQPSADDANKLTVTLKPIDVIQQNGELMVIQSNGEHALKIGDQVVTEGLDRLKEGGEVSVSQPAGGDSLNPSFSDSPKPNGPPETPTQTPANPKPL